MEPPPRRAGMLLLWGFALVLGCACSPLTGCGESESSHPQAGSPNRGVDSPAAFVRDNEDRLVVAKVNDVPVFADCVERQGNAHKLTAAAALDECIAFELLAQEALSRGYGRSAAAIEVQTQEAVRAFLAREFGERIARPEDLPSALVNAAYDQNLMRFQRPEYREAVYVRAELPNTNKDQGLEDQARGLATEIYQALATRSGLTSEEFFAEATRIAAGRHLGTGKPFNFPLRGRAVPEFADATFAIKEVGQVSRPVRTKWGWDVILWTRSLPEIDIDRAEAAALMFEALRSREFLAWAARQSDAHEIEVNDSALRAMAASADELAKAADATDSPQSTKGTGPP